jgi:hypothetical protein
MTLLLLVLLSPLSRATDAQSLTNKIAEWTPHRLSKSAPKITQKQVAEALSGGIVTGVEVVEQIKAGKGYAMGVFDIPIDVLWRGVSDEDHHAEFMAADISKTVDGVARRDGHTLFQYMKMPIISDRWWVVRMNFNGALYKSTSGKVWEVVWNDRQKDQALIDSLDPSMISEGIPIEWAKGSWLLVDLGAGKTFVMYHTWSDPGGRIPVGLGTRLAAGTVKNNLIEMTEFSKKHARTCPGQFFLPDDTPL